MDWKKLGKQALKKAEDVTDRMSIACDTCGHPIYVNNPNCNCQNCACSGK